MYISAITNSPKCVCQEQLHDDRGRVNALFEQALDAGIHIEVIYWACLLGTTPSPYADYLLRSAAQVS